jgi:hypothetical protein
MYVRSTRTLHYMDPQKSSLQIRLNCTWGPSSYWHPRLVLTTRRRCAVENDKLQGMLYACLTRGVVLITLLTVSQAETDKLDQILCALIGDAQAAFNTQEMLILARDDAGLSSVKLLERVGFHSAHSCVAGGSMMHIGQSCNMYKCVKLPVVQMVYDPTCNWEVPERSTLLVPKTQNVGPAKGLPCNR